MAKPKKLAPKSKSRPAAKPKAAPAAHTESLVEAVGSEEAFNRFLPEAMKLSADSLSEFRADAPLAYHNARIGADVVLAHEARVKAELPKIDLARVRLLPSLAQAVVFADEQVHQSGPVGVLAVLRPKLARARFLRTGMLGAADVLAALGLVSKEAVSAIRAGSGNLDMARDCVQLAALYKKNAAAIQGRHPFTDKDIAEAASLGTELQAMMKPKRGRAERPAGTPRTDAADARARLWTLLQRDYAAQVESAGGYLFGREAVHEVPGLQSRVVSGKRAAKGKPAVDTSKPA